MYGIQYFNSTCRVIPFFVLAYIWLFLQHISDSAVNSDSAQAGTKQMNNHDERSPESHPVPSQASTPLVNHVEPELEEQQVGQQKRNVSMDKKYL